MKKLRILVTGAEGFIGRNLVAALDNIKQKKDKMHGDIEIEEIYCYDIHDTREKLEEYCKKADFVYNLAGASRPVDKQDFMKSNAEFANDLLSLLEKNKNKCPVMLSSSVWATLAGRYADSDYGKTKLLGESIFFEYGDRNGADVLVYRFPNVFGKWARPNYCSVIATFCYNVANDMPITVDDPNITLELLYIDDLVYEMLQALRGKEQRCDYKEGNIVRNEYGKYCFCPVTHIVSLGEIVEYLKTYKKQPSTGIVPEMAEGSFCKKLYSTYLSYLPPHKIFKTEKRDQLSVNISEPGITKGQH